MSTQTKAEQRIKEELEPIDVEKAYDEMLCDTWGMVKVCGYEMSAAAILFEMDNTAWRCGLNDYVDAQVSDGQWYEQDGEYYNQNEADEIINQEGA